MLMCKPILIQFYVHDTKVTICMGIADTHVHIQTNTHAHKYSHVE